MNQLLTFFYAAIFAYLAIKAGRRLLTELFKKH